MGYAIVGVGGRGPDGDYLLTPWCRVLLEKLTGLQLVKKFPTFHGTLSFITALTSVLHLGSVSSPLCVCETRRRYVVKHNLITEVYLMNVMENNYMFPYIIHPSTPRSPQ